MRSPVRRGAGLAARAWRHLEEDTAEVVRLAATVVAYAAGARRPDLVLKLTESRETARRVEDLALALLK